MDQSENAQFFILLLNAESKQICIKYSFVKETSIFPKQGCNIKTSQGNYDGQKEAYQVRKYKSYKCTTV